MTALFHLEYALPVALATALALLFPVARHFRADERRRYYTLQVITLVGALVGAKLSALFGDFGWPWAPLPEGSAAWVSGRSVTGALILGFLAAEIAKPLLSYPLPPNDRFATLLPFSFAIGRLGCILAGCCRGVPWDGPWALRDAAGVARHPTQVYELLFELAVGAFFLVCLRREWLFGRLFALYLVLYGAFRFALEPLRDTPKLWDGRSGYQYLALVMIVLGGAFLARRTLAPPVAWQAFRRRSGPVPAV